LVRKFALPEDAYKPRGGRVVQAWVEDVPAVGFFRHEENGCVYVRPVPAVVVPSLGPPIFEQGHLKVYDYSPKFDEYGRPVAPVSIDTDTLSFRENPCVRILNHTVTLLTKEIRSDSESVEAPAPIGGDVPVVGVAPSWYWTLRVRAGHAVEVSSPDHPGQEIELQEGFFVLRHLVPEGRRID
jgi:hypothetical protein